MVDAARALFNLVFQYLRSDSPFAHRALVRCIRTIQTELTRTMLSAPCPGFAFIATPIQALFTDQLPSLTHILKLLSVLAVRFRRQYIHTPKMDWKTPFDTTLSFLDDCLVSSSAADLARTLARADKADFSQISRQSLVTEDAVVQRLLANWHTLSISVWECCSALPDLIPYLRECAQVSPAVPPNRSIIYG